MNEMEYHNRFGNKKGKWTMHCAGCNFGCEMRFDSGETVVPTRLDKKECWFKELFWPDPKPVWYITVGDERERSMRDSLWDWAEKHVGLTLIEGGDKKVKKCRNAKSRWGKKEKA